MHTRGCTTRMHEEAPRGWGTGKESSPGPSVTTFNIIGGGGLASVSKRGAAGWEAVGWANPSPPPHNGALREARSITGGYKKAAGRRVLKDGREKAPWGLPPPPMRG